MNKLVLKKKKKKKKKNTPVKNPEMHAGSTRLVHHQHQQYTSQVFSIQLWCNHIDISTTSNPSVEEAMPQSGHIGGVYDGSRGRQLSKEVTNLVFGGII